MTDAVQQLVASFEKLCEAEKRGVMTHILRHHLPSSSNNLSDEEFIAAAPTIFASLESHTVDEDQSEDAEWEELNKQALSNEQLDKIWNYLRESGQASR